jgi:hypothetical protein
VLALVRGKTNALATPEGHAVKRLMLSNIWWIILLVALAMLIAHAFSFRMVTVDNTSIILLLVVLLSPFISAIKKIKYGDFEAEIDPKEVQKLKEEVAADITDSNAHKERPSSEAASVMMLVESDPILALAKLRIELEQTLTNLTRITIGARPAGRVTWPLPLNVLVNALAASGTIPQDIADSCREVISLCSRAIHGEDIRRQDARSVADVGSSLLTRLSSYVEELLSGRPTLRGWTRQA